MQIFLKMTDRLLKAKKICLLALLSSWAVWLAGCSPDKKEMIFLTNHSFRLTVLATNEDGFDAPDGILWKDGSLYMADEGGPAFRIWTDAQNVKTLSDARDGISAPEDFVVDDDGTIYFTDDEVGGVWQISPQGETSLLAGKEKGLLSTEGIARSPSGQILAGDGKQGKIFSVSRHGEVEVFLDLGITKPESMVFDEQGNLFIADNVDNIVYFLTPDKELKPLIADRKGFSPESIWYANGTLYITDSDHGKLFGYNSETGFETLAEFGGVLAKVCGITTDERGSIYLSIQTHIDHKQSYVLRLDREN